MTTLNIQQAAELLNMHRVTLTRLAGTGKIPAAKPGGRWIFIEEDLIDWLRSHYAPNGQDEQAKEARKCSTNEIAPKNGGCASPDQTAKRYATLLARRTDGRRKNMKIS